MAVSLPSARHRGRAYAIPGVVDVWRVNLGEAAYDELVELLCAQERERAGRIVDARRRTLWARSRGVLRALLARYLDADPRALRFALGAHGKLRLRSEPRETRQDSGWGSGEDLRFNLSHSGELMLVAVTSGREVGVDVERASERYTTEFLRAWTVREATVKCLGVGLASAPVASDDVPEGMWAVELDVDPRAFAAVAVVGREACQLSLRDLPAEPER
jgi:4'-phosphopantetheinyl transferase